MKVVVYGMKVIEINDTFKILKGDNELAYNEFCDDLEESLQEIIKDDLGYDFEISRVYAADDDTLLYES